MSIIVPFCPIGEHCAGFFRTETNPGEHHGLHPHCVELRQNFFNIGFIIAFPERHPGEQTAFGEIRQNHIRLLAQIAHGPGVFHVESAVELAVVGHGRIHDDLAALLQEGVEHPGHIGNLLLGAQVAGVDGIKIHTLTPPVGRDVRNIHTDIPDMGLLKTAGMGGQNGGGNDAGFLAAGGENGQGHGHGALTQTGNILDRQNSIIFHGFTPGKGGPSSRRCGWKWPGRGQR